MCSFRSGLRGGVGGGILVGGRWAVDGELNDKWFFPRDILG